MTSTDLRITPMSFGPAQRREAVDRATAMGCGVHMAVGNSHTDFYADSTVEVGKVRITAPLTYKGFPEYIKTLESADEFWCPQEANHLAWATCHWCGAEATEPSPRALDLAWRALTGRDDEWAGCAEKEVVTRIAWAITRGPSPLSDRSES